jgi:hypothetical protein
MFRTALALLLLAAVASAEDSPLVALAKRSNRSASKTPVITNETLASSKGRISFTAGNTQSGQATSAENPAAVTPNVVPPVSSQAGRSATRVYPPATAAAAPTTEYVLPSTARNAEPQSSVRNVEPQSSVRNIEPQSTVRNAEPQSTARNVEPQSTVRNIEPQTTTTPAH